jgi:hypothetical protein
MFFKEQRLLSERVARLEATNTEQLHILRKLETMPSVCASRGEILKGLDEAQLPQRLQKLETHAKWVRWLGAAIVTPFLLWSLKNSGMVFAIQKAFT